MTELDYIKRRRAKLKLEQENKGKEDNSLKIFKLLESEAEDTGKTLPQVVREHNTKETNLENLFPHYLL